jgi:N6-adenosine-specific RNA methylase IME4
LEDDEIYNLPVNKISNENCLLFLWVVSPKLDAGINTGIKWGFDFSTIAFVWEKEKPCPGFYTLSSCELCLVFKKGLIPSPRGSRSEKQFLMQKKTRHSAKPDEIRKRIERMFPIQSKIELFARDKYPGWDVWGNDSDYQISKKRREKQFSQNYFDF